MGWTSRRVKKHGADHRRKWRKLHQGIDAQTLEIRAMGVTDNRTGDATMLPELPLQIPLTEKLVAVSTDSAYDTHLCHAAMQIVVLRPSFLRVETASSGKAMHKAIRLAASLCTPRGI